MDEFPPASQAVFNAAVAGDFERVRCLVDSGASLNAISTSGDTLLEEWVLALRFDGPHPHRAPMLRLLLQLGADPNALGEARTSALTLTALGMEIALIRILLEAGADPNLPSGFSDQESLYDWIEFDYRFRTWMVNNPEVDSFYPPEEPTPTDRLSDDHWLRYLDAMAVKFSVQRPGHLFLLREFGARTAQELAALRVV